MKALTFAGGMLAVVMAGSGTPLLAQAMPFGLREGQSKSELELLAGPLSQQDGTPPTYYAAHVPKPHPELTVYAVVVGGKLIDSTGVTDIEADRVFNELKSQLTAKYGKPSATERSQVRWLKISDAAIPPNLETIALNVAPQQTGSVLVSLRYRFSNVNRCGAPAVPGDPVRDAL